MSKDLFEEDLGKSLPYTFDIVLQVSSSWTYFILQRTVLILKIGSGLETEEGITIALLGQLLSSI